MIKFKCTKCGRVWYTSDMRSGQKCDDCKGELVEAELYEKEKLDKETQAKHC